MRSNSPGLTRDKEAMMYPIIKQIMLGRWALIEPAVCVYFLLCLVALLLCAQPRPNVNQIRNENQSIHAH